MVVRASTAACSSESNDVVDNFYGCYILVSGSEHPRYKNRCYIGFTTDPHRRIQQHNGAKKGGAKKTRDRGPWTMVLVVHGFPNEISALRFEWAWQNPTMSRRLAGQIDKKKPREKQLAYNLRVLAVMLSTAPWCRFSLTLRWLDLAQVTQLQPTPPVSLKFAYGAVQSETLQQAHVQKRLAREAEDPSTLLDHSCAICLDSIINRSAMLRCIASQQRERTDDDQEEATSTASSATQCGVSFHSICLARHSLSIAGEATKQVLPQRAHCPRCLGTTDWYDVVLDCQRRCRAVEQKKKKKKK